MDTRVRGWFFVALLTTAVGCGGGGGGDDGGSTNAGGPGITGSAPDVTVAQLAGTWSGTFDNNNTVQPFEFTVSGSNITDIKLSGAPTGLTGTVTKAAEAPRAFRFVLSSNGEVARGVWVVDPTGKYLTYVDNEFEFGVLQMGAPASSAFAQTDVNRSWTGDRVTTTSDFTTVASSAASGPCAAAAPSSQCDFTLANGTSRKLSAVGMNDANGRWQGTYADTPASNPAPTAPVARFYLSPDKKFAAAWTCPSAPTAATCDVYAFTATDGAPCTGTPDAETIANSAPNAAMVKTLFTDTTWSNGVKCITCHGGDGNLTLMTGNDWANNLINVNSSEQPTLKRINPGNAASSYVIHKLEGAPTITGARMPFGAEPLTAAQIDLVRAWINGMSTTCTP